MINYITGDATEPVGDGYKLIIHCCNDLGLWGAGFVLALSNKWEAPEKEYTEWSELAKLDGKILKLGDVQLVLVEPDIAVVNMIGQRGVRKYAGIPPIRYEAIRECLKQVATFAKGLEASVHAPRFGSGLAGGNWVEIEKIINEELPDISVTIYDFEEK